MVLEWNQSILKEKFGGSDVNRESTASSIKKDKLEVFIPGMGFYRISYFKGLKFLLVYIKVFKPPGPGFDDEDKVVPEESNNIELGMRFNQGFHNAKFKLHFIMITKIYLGRTLKLQDLVPIPNLMVEKS
ncbi:MAG: hypothetical protein CM1200mP10_04230 [Candidatus Neomarinimicrobiota bacterium]|nr:MAG: hypothetical protein CM1200mP10_04230 [Candidatus Neomarinimicrobiota bacterium]